MKTPPNYSHKDMSENRLQIQVHRATREDVDIISIIKTDSFPDKRRGIFSCFCKDTREETLDLTKQSYSTIPDEKISVCGLAKHGDEVLGACQLQFEGLPGDCTFPDSIQHTCDPGECYIEFVGVTESARGKGVGKALLDWAEEIARSMNCTKLRLEVVKTNRARYLYERQGFAYKRENRCKSICNYVSMCLLYCMCTNYYMMEKNLTD